MSVAGDGFVQDMRINTVIIFAILRHHLYITRTDDYSITEATLEAAFTVIKVDSGSDLSIGKLRVEFRTEVFDKDIKNLFVALILR
jgi:hypothetical protein